MKILCINPKDEQITKGKIYEAYNKNELGYLFYDDQNNAIIAEKENFISMTTENIKEHLLLLIKLIESFKDDIGNNYDLDKLIRCNDNLTSALGYLKLIN